MDIPIPPSPKRKNPPETELDRISQLPDHLILKILSIIPIKTAITTSFLSKRYQHLWTYLDRLHFNFQDKPCKRSFDKFLSFVDNVLLLSKSTNITKFFLQLDYHPQFNPRIKSWIHWALMKNVNKLLLDFRPWSKYVSSIGYVPEPFFELSHNLCTSSSLVTLYIARYKFQETTVINWNCLKRLVITNVVMDDGVMVKLLAGCPLLQRLQLISFSGFSNLRITNPNLKKLMLVNYWLPLGDYDRYDNVLNISAPYVEELEISDCMFDLQCRLVDVSSLAVANIDFELCLENDDYDIYRNVGKDLVRSVAHVKELTLGKWMLQVLSMLGRQSFSYSLSNCKCLTLNSCISHFDFPVVISLLHSSPQLETLVVNVDAAFKEFFPGGGMKPLHHESGKFPNLQNEIIKCLATHLKIVKIAHNQSCGCSKWDVMSQLPYGDTRPELSEDDNEEANWEILKRLVFEQDMCCKLVEFLLLNGKLVEQMVFCTSEREVCDICSRCCAFEYMLLVSEKLSTVPKSSPGAVIKFVEKQA